jgi:diguanylate cyclase (GGDEF)-like protein
MQILVFALFLAAASLVTLLLFRQRLLERLSRQQAISDAALNTMAQGLCMFGEDHRLIICNRRYAELYQLPEHLLVPGTHGQDMLRHQISMGFDPAKSQDYAEELLADVETICPHSQLELPDGRIVEIHRRVLPNGGWVSTHEDVTENRRAASRIAYLANHDPLTELPNRANFRQHLLRSVGHARRGHGFALHSLDLDRFKAVNDTLGHAAGDELLKQVAERLKKVVRDGDLVARLGGDEFAIIQFPLEHAKQASDLAVRVVKELGETYHIDGHDVVSGTSVGIALAPFDSLNPADLLQKSDMALYRAKSDGRGNHHFFEPGMDILLRSRRGLEHDLRAAIQKGQFELYFQPVLNLARGDIAGFEALIRWHHPVRGMILPEDFISVAEESGLIVRIGEWTLREACRHAAGWPQGINVSVNVSPAQFRNPNFIAMIDNALSAARLAPERLELELTESVLIENTNTIVQMLERLRCMGVKIAMDDFGSGYSSLNYLRSFPFDMIKIDRSFIHDLHKPDCKAIVHATIELSNTLGLRTTAEGVETSEQLAILRAEGCTDIQGFLVSHPLPAAQATALVHQSAADHKRLDKRKAS